MSDQKLDKIQEDITEIKVTLAENTASLKEHMRRTALLEAQVEPIKKHVSMVDGVMKFIFMLASVAAGAGAFLALWHK